MAVDSMPEMTHDRAYPERIASPALYLGELEVREQHGDRGARFSGTWLKNLFIPSFLWLVRHTPASVAILPARLLSGLARVLYPLSRNPLRRACEATVALAAHSGYHYRTARLYKRFLGNFVAVLKNYVVLYRDGADVVAGTIHIPEDAARRIEQLRQRHNGVILAVPHNLASAFSGLKLERTWPTLLVARNSSTLTRTRIQLRFFERMGVKILMVRGGNAFELSRAMYSALSDKYVIAATLDNISSQASSIQARIFGQTVALPSWAAKVAAKRGVPMVPVYFASEGREVTARFGEPLLSTDPQQLVQHYVRFFEQAILADPASWAYLGDKRWRRVLQAAAAM